MRTKIAKTSEDVYDWLKDHKPYDGAWVNNKGVTDSPENVKFFQLVADKSILHILREDYQAMRPFLAHPIDTNFLFEWDYRGDYQVNMVSSDQHVMTCIGLLGEIEKVEKLKLMDIDHLGKESTTVRIRFVCKRVIYISTRSYNYLREHLFVEVLEDGKHRLTWKGQAAVKVQFPRSVI